MFPNDPSIRALRGFIHANKWRLSDKLYTEEDVLPEVWLKLQSPAYRKLFAEDLDDNGHVPLQKWFPVLVNRTFADLRRNPSWRRCNDDERFSVYAASIRNQIEYFVCRCHERLQDREIFFKIALQVSRKHRVAFRAARAFLAGLSEKEVLKDCTFKRATLYRRLAALKHEVRRLIKRYER